MAPRTWPLFAPLLLAFVFLATSSYFREISLAAWTGEQLRPEDFAGVSARSVRFYASFLFLLLLSGTTFLPLGQEMGRAFGPLRPLVGYSWNLVRSLIGIWRFVLASWVQTSSVPWFAVVAVGAVLLERGWSRATTLACAAAAVFVVWHADREVTWSPYYKSQVNDYLLPDDRGVERKVGTYLRVHHDYYQRMVDLRAPFATEFPVLREALAYYDRPYRHVRPRSVLVLGAGTGNDVAAALRNGAERVDAVEIGPLILDLGRRMHPERPYDDPRVTVHVDDARSFLKERGERTT